MGSPPKRDRFEGQAAGGDPEGARRVACYGASGTIGGHPMGEKEDGGLGRAPRKASKWLKDQGITGETWRRPRPTASEGRPTRSRPEMLEPGRPGRDGPELASDPGRKGRGHSGDRAFREDRARRGLAPGDRRAGGSGAPRGGSFTGISFGIPGYAGAGTYDLGPVDLGDHIIELWLERLKRASTGHRTTVPAWDGIRRRSHGRNHFVFRDPGSNASTSKASCS